MDKSDFSNAPQNNSQIYNANRRRETGHQDMLADVIEQQQYKLKAGSTKFVRKVVLEESGPLCINCTNQQITDIARFCQSRVLSIDVIYN